MRNVTKDGPNGPPMAIPDLPENLFWGPAFRVEYVPPTRAESAGLPDFGLIRHSRLRSPRFSLAGRID